MKPIGVRVTFQLLNYYSDPNYLEICQAYNSVTNKGEKLTIDVTSPQPLAD